MKTLFCNIAPEKLIVKYNLGKPVVISGEYAWVISDALYTLLLLTHPMDGMRFSYATKDSLYMWVEGTISYYLESYHNHLIKSK